MYDLSILTPVSLLLLRLIIAVIFFSSGRSHVQDPEKRGESIGMSPTETRIMGLVEIVAAVSIGLGIFTQIGALLIIGTMLGAIYKKVFVWNTGFYSKEGFGWHYDLLLLLGALVVLATGGGVYVLL